MRDPRWIWLLVPIAAAFILLGTVRDSGWVSLGVILLIFVGAFGVVQVAMRHGYEWRRNRAVGVYMLAVMIVALIVTSTVTASAELSILLAGGCGAVTLLAVSLRRVS
jgi:hypothetical protein